MNVQRFVLLCLLCACTVSGTFAFSPLSNKDNVCIVGAGPVGLYLAILLLKEDPSIRLTILERKPQEWETVNAFGIGMSTRMNKSLQEMDGLQPFLERKTAQGIFGRLISRADLSGQLLAFLKQKVKAIHCQVYLKRDVKAWISTRVK